MVLARVGAETRETKSTSLPAFLQGAWSPGPRQRPSPSSPAPHSGVCGTAQPPQACRTPNTASFLKVTHLKTTKTRKELWLMRILSVIYSIHTILNMDTYTILQVKTETNLKD